MIDEIVLPQCFGRHWEGTKDSVCVTQCDPEYQKKCLHIFAMETLPKAIERLGSKSLNKLAIFTGCSPEAILIAMNYKNDWPHRDPIKIEHKTEKPEKEKIEISKKVPLAKPTKKGKSKFEKEKEKYSLDLKTGDSLEIKRGESAFTLLVESNRYCLLGTVDGRQERKYFDTLTHVAQHVSGRKRGINGCRYFKRELDKLRKEN